MPPESRGSFHGGCPGHRDLYLVWGAPSGLPSIQLQTVHRDLDLLMANLHEQVVIVDLLALKWIVRRTLDRICVRGATAAPCAAPNAPSGVWSRSGITP